MRYLAATIFLLFLSGQVQAAIHVETVEYRHDEAVLEGVFAWDDALAGQRPGVLVVHEWTGINNHIKERIEKLASLGYLAFAADIYGKGIRPQGREAASAQAKIYRSNIPLMRERVRRGLETLTEHQLADPQKTAAIGYCFGGTTALELARSGANLKGVVSFHGGLATQSPEDAKNIRAKVLVLHGADDPHVPPKEVLAFQDEMRNAGVDWQMIHYSNAVHSFTNKQAGNDNSKGAAYNEMADKRSWEAMKLFFGEIFQ